MAPKTVFDFFGRAINIVHGEGSSAQAAAAADNDQAGSSNANNIQKPKAAEMVVVNLISDDEMASDEGELSPHFHSASLSVQDSQQSPTPKNGSRKQTGAKRAKSGQMRKQLKKLAKTGVIKSKSSTKDAEEKATGGAYEPPKDKYDFSIPKASEAEQRKIVFLANAVLQSAFSPEIEQNHHHQVIKWGIPNAFDVMTAAAQRLAKANKTKAKQFKFFDKRDYFNTASMLFDVSVWGDGNSDDRRHMQSITFLGTYENFSFEELRFGDYLWGRTAAPHRFTLFPRLPAELRAMIWEYCCGFPRTVELRYGMPIGRPRSPTRPPFMLQVSQEARKIALKYYELAFHICPHPTQIYFNFEVDTLALAYNRDEYEYGDIVDELGGFVITLRPEDRKRVRFLAFEDCLFDLFKEIWYDLADETDPDEDLSFIVLSDFPKLESFSVVVTEGEEEHCWGKSPCHCEWDCEAWQLGPDRVDPIFVEATAKSVRLEKDVAAYKAVLRAVSRRNKDWKMPSLKFMKRTCVHRKKVGQK